MLQHMINKIKLGSIVLVHNLYAPIATRESRSDDRRARFPFVSYALHNRIDSGRPIGVRRSKMQYFRSNGPTESIRIRR